MNNNGPIQELNPPGSQLSPASQESTQGNPSQRLLWALVGFVAALTLVVVLVLPYLMTERVIGKPSSSTQVEALKPKPLVVSVNRNDAELELQKFLRLRARPRLAGAELWAAADWQAAIDAATGGDDLYGNGRFKEALSSYKKASLKLQALLDNRPQYLADSLALGWELLEKNNSDEAISAFERVIAMHLKNEEINKEAAAGLARAKVRSEVLRLMRVGRQAEAENNLQQAAMAYTSVLELDADYPAARQASQQLTERIDRLEFQKAMSEALQNIDNGRFDAAGKALMRAAKIYPDHPAVSDTKSRLAMAGREYTLNRLRRQAAQADGREDWAAAIEFYRKALVIDSQAAFALGGLAYARQRAQLHSQFRHYLADPDRLYSEEPLVNARKLLAANKQIPDREAVLAKMATQLQEAVRLALIPVELVIQSDKQTEVAIYHVGRLGRFEEKIISLRPGNYTVTGNRPGFRDVRRVIKLRPGSSMTPLLIRCEEPV